MESNQLSVNTDSPAAIAALIDHTLLKPDARLPDILQLCSEAAAAHFASVCLNPYWVPLAAEKLQNSSVRVCTVIGFPLGANHPGAKLHEARIALTDGATELDMVLNIGAFRSGQRDIVAAEISELAAAAHEADAILKVILETCLLTDDEKRDACLLAMEANADFVKTSTGFSTGGATEADVRLMRQVVGLNLGVKASGGVRTLAALRAMLDAGASRIGTSSGVSILHELKAPGDSPSNQNVGTY